LKLLTVPPEAALRSLETAYHKVAAIGVGVVVAAQATAIVIAWLTRPGITGAWWQPAALAGLAVVTALVRMMSRAFAARADVIKRRREFLDGLGRQLSVRERAEVVDDAPAVVLWSAERSISAEPYFASPAPSSPLRAIQNTYESAWWTSRLAKDMVGFESARTLVIAVAAALLLRVGLGQTAATSGLDPVKIASAALLFLLTGAPMKQAIDYLALYRGAERAAERAERACKRTPTELEAVEVLMSYQLVRKGAPLIPSWLWRVRRNGLNQLWASVAQELPSGGQ
jgi:hypothetical protein